MQNKLKTLLILGFAQLFIFVIVSNHFSSPTTNIFGHNAFKLGNKTFVIEEVDGLEFSTDEHYSNAFSQPYASFFILKEIEDFQVELVLSGSRIRTNNYQNFDDIISDYKSDSTLTVISAENINNYLDVKFINNADSSDVIFARFYQAYPYFLQLFGFWQGDSDNMPEEMQNALNSVKILE